MEPWKLELGGASTSVRGFRLQVSGDCSESDRAQWELMRGHPPTASVFIHWMATLEAAGFSRYFSHHEEGEGAISRLHYITFRH